MHFVMGREGGGGRPQGLLSKEVFDHTPAGGGLLAKENSPPLIYGRGAPLKNTGGKKRTGF